MAAALLTRHRPGTKRVTSTRGEHSSATGSGTCAARGPWARGRQAGAGAGAGASRGALEGWGLGRGAP